jgi:thiol:disulfide interchange protein
MPDANSPKQPRWLWGFLLLPVCLIAGWGMGRVPAPSQSTPPANSSPPVAGTGDELSQWTSLANATAESQRNGKPILIDFSADWCGPCQALKQTVFEDAQNGRIVKLAVIPVSVVDRNREEGENPGDIQELQDRYGVNAFPTLVVFSPRTGKSEKVRGYGGPDRTVAWIKEAVRKVR